MDRRQKILIALLTLIVVGFLGEQTYRTWYEEPLEKSEQLINSLEDQLRKGLIATRSHQKLLNGLDAIQQQSLPRNFEIAVTKYRAWLFQTIAECQLQAPNLNSSTPARFRNLYMRIDFNVRSRGTLTQWTRFLHQFYDTQYLHKIRSLSMTPTSDGTLDVSLNIETLAVPAAALDDTLPKPQRNPNLASLEDYLVIAQRNIFRQGQPPASQIKLSAITRDRAKKHRAWLNFRKTGKTQIVSKGEKLLVDGTQLEICEIHLREIEVAIDGEPPHRVTIGQSLE